MIFVNVILYSCFTLASQHYLTDIAMNTLNQTRNDASPLADKFAVGGFCALVVAVAIAIVAANIHLLF